MKIKTKILTMAAAVILFSAKGQVNSQFHYGPTGGFGIGSAEIGDFGRSGTQTIAGKNVSNFNIGFFIQPQRGAFYTKSGLTYCVEQGTVRNGRTNTFSMEKLEVPLLFGTKIFGPIIIEGGPVYNYMLNISRKYDTDYNNTQFGKNGMGFRLGAGLDFDSFFVIANFERITFSDPANMNAFREPAQFTMTAGLKFEYLTHKTVMDSKRYSITPGR